MLDFGIAFQKYITKLIYCNSISFIHLIFLVHGLLCKPHITGSAQLLNLWPSKASFRASSQQHRASHLYSTCLEYLHFRHLYATTGPENEKIINWWSCNYLFGVQYITINTDESSLWFGENGEIHTQLSIPSLWFLPNVGACQCYP